MTTTALDSTNPVLIGGSIVGPDASWTPAWSAWVKLPGKRTHTIGLPAHSVGLIDAILQ